MVLLGMCALRLCARITQPHQQASALRRKNIKKGLQFTVMVVGMMGYFFFWGALEREGGEPPPPHHCTYRNVRSWENDLCEYDMRAGPHNEARGGRAEPVDDSAKLALHRYVLSGIRYWRAPWLSDMNRRRA